MPKHTEEQLADNLQAICSMGGFPVSIEKVKETIQDWKKEKSDQPSTELEVETISSASSS